MFRNRFSSLSNRSLRHRNDKRTRRTCQPRLDGFVGAVMLELRLAPSTPFFTLESQTISATSTSVDFPASGPGAPTPQPTQSQTNSGSSPPGPDIASVGASSSISNVIIGTPQEVSEGVFVFITDVDASETGTVTTTQNITPGTISLTGDMQNQDYVAVSGPGMYTLNGGLGQYVQTTAANGKFTASTTNATGQTLSIDVNVSVTPPAPNFAVHAGLTLATPQITVTFGYNEPGMPEGFFYSDAATHGVPTPAPFNGTSGAIKITAPASATQTANYSSSLMTGPNGTFTNGGSPGGKYGQAAGFTWAYTATLNT